MDFIPRDLKLDAPQASPLTSTKTYYLFFNFFLVFYQPDFTQAGFSAHALASPSQSWQLPCHIHIPLSPAHTAAPKTSMKIPMALLSPKDLEKSSPLVPSGAIY